MTVVSPFPSVRNGREPSPLLLELVLTSAGKVTLVKPVRDGDIIYVGRAPECTIPVDDDAMSRRHATLEVHGHGVHVIDTSTNGTLADGVVLRQTSCQVEFGKRIAKAARGSVDADHRAPPISSEAASASVIA